MGPEARERALFGAISRLVHARAEEGGGVILVEDLHWLDPGSEAFLANLIESLPGTRTLLVVNFRPEYDADWMKKSYYQRLPLLPLSDEAIAAMVRDLIGDDPSLDGIGELIAERTGGNPFFIEEVVQSLVDGGSLVGRRGAYRLAASIDRLEIPPTVQAVLAARIDRLDERDKSVLAGGGRDRAGVLRAGAPARDRARAARAARVARQAVRRGARVRARPLPGSAVRVQAPAHRGGRVSHAAGRAPRADARRGRRRARGDGGRPARRDRGAPVEPLGAGARAGEGRAVGARAAATWAGQSHPADALRHWRRVRTLLEDSHDDPEAAGLALGACLWILQFGWRQGLSDDEVEAVWREGLALAERSGNTWAKSALYGSHARLARDGRRGAGGARARPRGAASRAAS